MVAANGKETQDVGEKRVNLTSDGTLEMQRGDDSPRLIMGPMNPYNPTNVSSVDPLRLSPCVYGFYTVHIVGYVKILYLFLSCPLQSIGLILH